MKSNSKFFDKIRIRPNSETEVRSRVPVCQWDGCKESGTHRAPVGRMAEGQYFKFCFDHVRAYNKSFNYFSGLADGDIARFQKEALTGHRPTWSISSNGLVSSELDSSQQRSNRTDCCDRMRDPHNMFGTSAALRQRKAKPLEAKALETLGLASMATGADIKARYKELVKLHHPDANGGDRGSEDRLREVLQAYRQLKQAGFC